MTHHLPPPPHAKECIRNVPHKENVGLYLDAELVEKTRELDLSFEHFKIVQ
jgi:hypothetical protein